MAAGAGFYRRLPVRNDVRLDSPNAVIAVLALVKSVCGGLPDMDTMVSEERARDRRSDR
jgi:hypothetical protein